MNDERESADSLPVVIVGAGLAGLSCAWHLHLAGIPVKVLEASNGVGGRVRTDVVEGFLLDRGFQVYLSAYPEAGKILDLDALDLRAFEPGALVFDGEKLHAVMDVFRRPGKLLESALAPVGTLRDKMRVALLRFRSLGSSDEEIAGRADSETRTFLTRFGFSQKMIDGFFRAFYGGIFLERELRTSSRMFEFTFKMFSKGSATLPAKGMGEIPLQLARRLPPETIRLNATATSITPTSVTLAGAEKVRARRVVVATQATQTGFLVPEFQPEVPGWRSVTNLYFSADESPLSRAIIALNASGQGLVNNVCVLSDVAPSYAPEGKSLISISVLGLNRSPELPQQIQSELSAWFGEQVRRWRHLRTDLIKQALPDQLPNSRPDEHKGFKTVNGVWICGDHVTSASIEGAIVSGAKTAASLLENLRS